jgi:hypothetical protein
MRRQKIVAFLASLASLLHCFVLHAEPTKDKGPPQKETLTVDKNISILMPKHAQQEWNDIFEPQHKTPKCKILSKGFQTEFNKIAPKITGAAANIMQIIKSKNIMALRKAFHPRIKISLTRVSQIFDEINGYYGAGNISIFRIYALDTINGDPRQIYCNEDELEITTHYGHPLQFAVWIQVSGKREIGRIFITFVPVGDEYKIAAMHQQQWTHKGRDAQRWVAEALIDRDAENAPSAFLKLDLAQKLLNGGNLIETQLARDIETTKQSLLKKTSLFDLATKIVGDQQLVHVTSFFAPNGIGILFRLYSAQQPALRDIKARCRALGESFYKNKWAKKIDSIHCDFTDNKNVPTHSGRFGGMTLSQAEFTPQN